MIRAKLQRTVCYTLAFGALLALPGSASSNVCDSNGPADAVIDQALRGEDPQFETSSKIVEEIVRDGLSAERVEKIGREPAEAMKKSLSETVAKGENVEDASFIVKQMREHKNEKAFWDKFDEAVRQCFGK